MQRKQTLGNLYYNLFGEGARHLPLEGRVEVYLEADGFGDTRSGEARERMVDYMRHGWDWSHVRDSSDEALERAQARLTALFRAIIAEQKAAASAAAAPASWAHGKIAGGGDRARYVSPAGDVLATVVKLPGTLTRIYWHDGTMSDRHGFDDALRTVEARVEVSA